MLKVQVHAKIEYDINVEIGSFLQVDQNIIILGEMRDLTTAHLGIHELSDK